MVKLIGYTVAWTAGFYWGAFALVGLLRVISPVHLCYFLAICCAVVAVGCLHQGWLEVLIGEDWTDEGKGPIRW
jgi:hypothetical protein